MKRLAWTLSKAKAKKGKNTKETGSLINSFLKTMRQLSIQHFLTIKTHVVNHFSYHFYLNLNLFSLNEFYLRF